MATITMDASEYEALKKIVQSKWNVFNYLDNLQKLKQKL